MSSEPLEARLLLSTTSVASGSLPVVSNLATGTQVALSRSSTTTNSPDSADNFTITGTSASLSIQGVTSTTSVALTYSWATTQAPNGGVISYSKNATNLAKDNTLTFTRAGSYVARVSILSGNTVVSTLSLQLTVTQLATRVGLLDGLNKSVNSGSVIPVTTSLPQLSAVVTDQFTQPLLAQPEVIWSVVSGPVGGSATLTTTRNSLATVVNKAGTYSLNASANLLAATVSFNVSQVITSVALNTSTVAVVDSSQPLLTIGTTQNILVKCFDQFGNAMLSSPTITWSTISGPSGGTASMRFSSGVATATLTRSGVYVIKGVTGSQVFTFQVSAEATLSRISVRTPENREVTSCGTVTVSGTRYQLGAVCLDQFSQPMAVPPEITWQVVSGVSGGTATLTSDGNSVVAEVNKAGSYSLRAISGSILSNVTLSVSQVLTTFRVANVSGEIVDPTIPVSVRSTTSRLVVQAMDQFGNPMASLPSVAWSTVLAPSGGTASTVFSGGLATITFSRTGDYVVRAVTGAFVVSIGLQVIPTLQSIAAFGADGRPLTSTVITVAAKSTDITLIGLDQFRLPLSDQPEFLWSEVTSPAEGSASFNNSGSSQTITFDKAGNYTVRATADALSVSLNFSVVQTLSSISLTPGNLTISYGITQQFIAKVFDQFEMPFSVPPTILWSATGGTITSSGVYTAGTLAGLYSVTAKSGTLTSTLPLTIIAPTIPDGLLDPDLANLVKGYYGDGLIDRIEMISILRSAGVDGMVSATELADFRFLVSSTTPYTIPQYVRGLATDVVNASPANLKYKGQAAGNLAAGSSSTLLNNLVDKWFLGTDEPALTTSLLSYQTTTGNLFNGTPSRADARQGALGDCYFIAAVTSIADSNPEAVRNMFVDNGDGTYTVRFHGVTDGAADYVTVNRPLPAQYNGALGYSGYGLSVSSESTTVWVALAEKTYAQWNETGNEGRDGANRYAAFEGGWVEYVNAQVLGTASSNYSLASFNKQTLITALSSQKAVTIGANTSVSAGLYGSHAYLVAGYEASTDTFQLHNPWGFSHPGVLSYPQLQAYCSMFVVADASGSSPISGSVSGTTSIPLPACAGFASSREEWKSGVADLDAVSGEYQRDYSIAQVEAESSANSERRSDRVSPRRLTGLRINFMQDGSVESYLWGDSLPQDHLTELELDLIHQLFAERDEPIAV